MTVVSAIVIGLVVVTFAVMLSTNRPDRGGRLLAVSVIVPVAIVVVFGLLLAFA